jgi:hypothetical protein
MTERLQPGLHPDEEILNAFAEGALPPHARAHTLTHLAACADCRQIVFLAQQAAPQPVAATVSFWRRYRHSITLFGTALGLPALACLLILFVTLRQHGTAAPTESARVQPPASPQSTPTVSPQPATPKPTPSSSALKGTGFIPYERAKKKDGALAPEGVALPPARRMPPPLPKAQPPLIAAKEPGLSRPLGFMGMGMATGTGRAPTAGAAGPVRSLALSSVHGDAAPQAAAPPPVDAVNLGNGLPTAAAPAPASSNGAVDGLAAPHSSAQTVTVQSADVLSMDSADESAAVNATLSGAAMAKKRNLRAAPLQSSEALPSNLPTTWLVSSGARTLAADTAGALFLSLDAGRHWQPVAAAWPGKVAQLKLAAAPAVFQLITTTGAVWLSPDGLRWQPQ